jgi:mRNA-degrading endonuclease toxin of MazEF toxin-antitoxin module
VQPEKLISMSEPTPRRGEIWLTRYSGEPPKRHWVVIVSLDSRNLSRHVDSLLVVPFTSKADPVGAPTVLKLEPGESGLPQTSHLRGHFISTMKKSELAELSGRPLSNGRMRELCLAIRRSFDPDAPADNPKI